MKKIILIVFLFQSCIGAGDMFASKKKVIGSYYLVEGDTGDYSMCYKTDEGFTVRNPYKSTVLSYAIKDSLLAMLVQFYDSSLNYYIINMSKDWAYAKEEEYFMECIETKDLESSWLGKQNLIFKRVK